MVLPRRVEFIRVSSKGQAKEDTPAAQRAAFDRLRKFRPASIVEVIDVGAAGLSATSLSLDQRPDLLRLRELSEQRAYDEVAVRHLDRLTRHADPLERALILSMVRKAGAVIVEADGSVLDPRTMAGELTWVVKTIAANEEIVKFRTRSIERRTTMAGEGVLLGRAPYGRAYNRKTRTWSVTPEATVYKRIFVDWLAGWSTYRLAAQLNQEGVPTPCHGALGWTGAKIANLLRHRSAIGEITSMRLPQKCPPVIDRAVWDAVQARLHSPGRAGRPTEKPALVRGVAVCGACGSPVWIHTARARTSGGRAEYRYYACRHHRTARTPECRRYYRVETVDAEAREALLAWLEADLPAVGTPQNDPREVIVDAETQLAALATEEGRLLRAARKATDPEAIAAVLGELAEEKRGALARLTEARALAATPREPAVDREVRAALLRRARRATPAQLRDLVTTVLRPGSVVLLPGPRVEIRAIGPQR